MSARQEFRQHSKSTLLRAASIIMRERDLAVFIERRKWQRRCAWIAAGVLLLGAVVGNLLGGLDKL